MNEGFSWVWDASYLQYVANTMAYPAREQEIDAGVCEGEAWHA